MPLHHKLRRAGGSSPLVLRGYGSETGIANDGKVRFDTVTSGAAPVAGDFVFAAMFAQSGGNPSLNVPTGWTNRAYDSMSGAKSGVLITDAGGISQADIDTPVEYIDGGNTEILFWAAFQMNGVDVSSSAGSGEMTSGNPANRTADASAVAAPVLGIEVIGARSASPTITNHSLDGDADAVDSGFIHDAANLDRLRVFFKAIQTGLGQSFNMNAADNGFYNYGGAAYVAFA